MNVASLSLLPAEQTNKVFGAFLMAFSSASRQILKSSVACLFRMAGSTSLVVFESHIRNLEE